MGSRIVAVGYGFSRWLEMMRSLEEVDLVFPEFFDRKDLLVARRWRAYLRELRRRADEVEVAVWPDYCYDPRVRDAFPVKWVFPLHSKSELGFALRVADFVGFPNREELRDYSLSWFSSQRETYGFRAWLLGLKPRYLRALPVFEACDLTAASVPSRGGRRSKWREWREVPVEEWRRFVLRVKSVPVARRWRW